MFIIILIFFREFITFYLFTLSESYSIDVIIIFHLGNISFIENYISINLGPWSRKKKQRMHIMGNIYLEAFRRDDTSLF